MLEKKLAASRKKEQDLAQPSNWLTIASAADMAGIAQRWALPEHYRRFLACHSPLRVLIDSQQYFQGLSLYGAAGLIKAQHGYAWNPVSGETIAGWPEQYLVIADAGADPYCLDLGAIADGDAPVYHAEHGMGAWCFDGIAQRWTLPEHYRRFIACHSPLRVFIDSQQYFQGLSLYGAAELVKAQHGYAWNPVSQETIAGWPDQYLVIADAGADPYCLDLGNIVDGDAPVYHAEHGMGTWRFERHVDSFIDFLNEIAAAA